MNQRTQCFAALAAMGLALAGCPGGGDCGAANCNGCCDSSRQCVTGDTTAQCGRSGLRCAACLSGQACVAGTCTSSMGGGTGTGSGGGSGGGGGSTGDGGCLEIDWSTATSLGGAFTPAAANGNPPYNAGIMGRPSATASRLDFLTVELWYFGGSEDPTFPYTMMLAPTTWTDCEGCVIYEEACDQTGGDCARAFLAQEGTVVFASATRDQQQGEFRGSGNNLVLQQWDLTPDVAVDGGRCVRMSYAMNVSWGLDGGAGDGGLDDAGTTDAGVDGGADAGVVP